MPCNAIVVRKERESTCLMRVLEKDGEVSQGKKDVVVVRERWVEGGSKCVKVVEVELLVVGF